MNRYHTLFTLQPVEYRRNRVMRFVEEFGFNKLTVERPLRLNFAFTEERIARLENELGFQKLATSQKHREDQRLAEIEAGKQRQEEIRIFLKGLTKTHGDELFSDREQFLVCSFWVRLIAL